MVTNVMVGRKRASVVTQQYQVGLYVAIYWQGKSIPDQLSLDCHDEQAFHNDIIQGKFFNKKVKVINPELQKRLV